MRKNRIHYDSDSDTLYLMAGKGQEEEFVEVAPGINVELDADGNVIGIEVLRASVTLKPVLQAMSKRVAQSA